MPNSFTRVLSVTLGFSPHLPVSVYGTDTLKTHLEVFLGGMFRTSLWANALLITSRSHDITDFPVISSYPLEPAHPIAGQSFTSASPHRSNAAKVVQEYFACFPSLTPLGLSLGSD